MKRIVMAVAVGITLAGGGAFAADGADTERDWCLLGIASKCAGTTTIDLIDKIKRVKVAIEKGSPVYSPEETEHFKRLLEELQYTQEILLRPGR